jgi:hypothetical protein
MTLTRNQFFLLLLVLFVCPFVAWRLWWLARSEKAQGRMWFDGRTIEVQGTSHHPVYQYRLGNDSIWFHGNLDLGHRRGDIVSVRYQPGDLRNARIDAFLPLWYDTLAYLAVPFLILLIVFIKTDIVPWQSRVRLGGKPFLKIMSP